MSGDDAGRREKLGAKEIVQQRGQPLRKLRRTAFQRPGGRGCGRRRFGTVGGSLPDEPRLPGDRLSPRGRFLRSAYLPAKGLEPFQYKRAIPYGRRRDSRRGRRNGSTGAGGCDGRRGSGEALRRVRIRWVGAKHGFDADVLLLTGGPRLDLSFLREIEQSGFIKEPDKASGRPKP